MIQLLSAKDALVQLIVMAEGNTEGTVEEDAALLVAKQLIRKYGFLEKEMYRFEGNAVTEVELKIKESQ
jgi:hypothetical protein